MSDVIKLHDLRPAPGSKKAKTRVGRGEGSKGKTAGRGTKGTKARKNVPVGFEGGQMPIHMRLPKLKGFKNRFRTEYDVVNVGDLEPAVPRGWHRRRRRPGRQGCGSQERPGEGARRRQADRQGRRHRAQVQRQRPREDHRRGRLGHRAVTPCREKPRIATAPARRVGRVTADRGRSQASTVGSIACSFSGSRSRRRARIVPSSRHRPSPRCAQRLHPRTRPAVRAAGDRGLRPAGDASPAAGARCCCARPSPRSTAPPRTTGWPD